MELTREWAMPNSNTFDVLPILHFVKKYLLLSHISVDPYARNKRWATYSNDLNPNTHAEYHMDAIDFLFYLGTKDIRADLIILDPPYSPRQVMECYNAIGIKMRQSEAMLGATRKTLKKAINGVITNTGRVLTFGWNSSGMGKGAGYEIEEVMIVCHGSDHNDTICMSERRTETFL